MCAEICLLIKTRLIYYYVTANYWLILGFKLGCVRLKSSACCLLECYIPTFSNDSKHKKFDVILKGIDTDKYFNHNCTKNSLKMPHQTPINMFDNFTFNKTFYWCYWFVKMCAGYLETLGIHLNFEEIRKLSKFKFKKIVNQKTY